MKKICLFYFLSLLGLSNIQAQSCIPDLTFTGPYTVAYTKSKTWIKSSGVTTIPASANVTWDANPLAGVNGYVELNPGFKTMPNSEFLAIVQAVCAQTALSVKLVSLDVKAQGEKIHLNWVTISELNSLGFEIERSGNGQDFTKIGFVKSETETGSSNEKLGYSFIDHSPEEGYNYYRLKQLDLDGKFEYSQIKSVKMEGKETINIYPNPVTDFVTIETLGQKIKSVELLDARGSSVYQTSQPASKIDMTNQTPGIYFLKMEKMDGRIVVRKVLKK